MLRLRDSNKAHLSALVKQDESCLQDFCRLAWDYVAKGVNTKLYASASGNILHKMVLYLGSTVAKLGETIDEICRPDSLANHFECSELRLGSMKLGISHQDLQHITEGLVNVLTEACKLKLTIQSLRTNLLSLGFNEKQSEILCTFYSAKQADINNVLLSKSVRLPTFKDLEWRTQAQIASRALPDQLTPNVLLLVKLENSQEDSILFKTDPGNLVHVTEILESALEQANGQHANRVRRRFQT